MMPSFITTPRTVHKLAFFALLLAMATETFVSAGFLREPSLSSSSTAAAARQFDHPRYKSHRGFYRNAKKSINHVHPSAVIRGGDNRPPILKDYDDRVAKLFGNLRVPASLIASASIASAFDLPMLEKGGVGFGLANRMYTFSLMTSLGSMLLVVILSTICMNDIAVLPNRRSKSLRDYIDEHYLLEWMVVKCHFYYGNLAFIVAAAVRACISIKWPVIRNGVLGILFSLTLISMSNLVEKSKNQTGVSFPQGFILLLKKIWAKAKTDGLFGAGAMSWVMTVIYLFYNIPHMYRYLAL